MKISIRNFKAISRLKNYHLNSLNILSGVNSGGKTSFLQFLLLIKQTIEANSTDNLLVLNKPYVSLGTYKEMLHKKRPDNRKFGFKIILEEDDLVRQRISFLLKKALKHEAIKHISIELEFHYVSGKIQINKFTLSYKLEQSEIWVQLDKVRGKKYNMTTNNMLFLDEFFREQHKKDESIIKEMETEMFSVNVRFDRLFPSNITFIGPQAEEFSDYYGFSPLMSNAKRLFLKVFSGISYIGPLREEPHLYYINEDDSELKIGNKGEHAAYILAKKSTEKVSFYKANVIEGKLEYYLAEAPLEDAVNYWVNEMFLMAQEVKVKKYRYDTIYELQITNNKGLNTPITQVGFGLSQVLPIIIEGLRLKEGSILILEQPEIHLHPRIQSLLFDFLYSLTLKGVKVVVETHSDHLITRMRRRIAEDNSDTLYLNINMVFFEESDEQNTELNLTKYGNVDFWPLGFFDQYDKDLKAIVRAQSMKRIKNRKEVEQNE